VLPTIEELIKINNDSLTVLNGTLQALRDSIPGQDPDDKARILARVGRVGNEINRLTNILIHLHASTTTVEPMPAETVERLDALAAALDRAIMRQAWLDASLDILQGFVETASKVRKITDLHT
jgi:hypothetical protein